MTPWSVSTLNYYLSICVCVYIYKVIMTGISLGTDYLRPLFINNRRILLQLMYFSTLNLHLLRNLGELSLKYKVTTTLTPGVSTI